VRLTRVYIDAPLESGTRVKLEGNAASHVTRVLRLRVGEALTLFNGQGGEYAAGIEQAHGGSLTIAVGEHRAVERESTLSITLAQGVSRGERMDLVVQKATELGVSVLAPLLTERSVVRLDAQQAERKLNHWRAIAIAACEQSARNRLPQILEPVSLREFLRHSHERGGTRLLLSPTALPGIAELEAPPAELSVLIGPEGGLSPEEQQAALAAGFLSVRLGPRVLRTETAALAALALLQHRFGDM
jgi:16S rRNA (uracil1498-N3)-methyltransferase